MSDRKYTVDEVKAAFYKTFHEAGEIFFPYGADKEGNQEATESWWSDFAETLDKETLDKESKDNK